MEVALGGKPGSKVDKKPFWGYVMKKRLMLSEAQTEVKKGSVELAHAVSRLRNQ